MDSEKFSFGVAVLISIFSAYFTRSINDARTRKVCGTWIGVVISFLLLEDEIYHALALVLINAVVISWCKRRYVHIISMTMNWSLLIYHHGTSPRKYSHLIFQTLVLRMTGLASEMHTSQEIMMQTAGFMNGVHLTSKYALLADKMSPEPDVLGMLHYSFNFIGLIGGPYYRWTTYNDYLLLPVSDINICYSFNAKKMREVAFWTFLYLWIDFKYTAEVYTTLEFYWTNDALFRFTYNAPRLVLHVARHLLFSTILFWLSRIAGLGLYPEQCKPLPGNGPMCRFELMHAIRHNPHLAIYQHYSAATVQLLDLHRVLTAPNMRKTLRSWDSVLQYWMWANVYRKIPFGGKNFKTAATLSVWLLWWGATIQRVIFVYTIWFYLVMEDVYYTLIVKYTYGHEMTTWKVAMMGFRFLCFVYLYPCLLFENSAMLIAYYSSIFWFYHGVIFVLLLLASYIMNMDFFKTIVVARLEGRRSRENVPVDSRCDCDSYIIQPESDRRRH